MENGSSDSTNESGFAPMDSANNHETMDIAVGCAFSITSLLCLVVYWIILKIMICDSDLIRLTAYKFMIMLALFDNIQLVAHFITGLMTIWQTVWDPTLAKVLGCMATPSYVGYVMTTLCLAISRLFQFCFPRQEYAFFEAKKFLIWLIVILIPVVFFVVALGSPYAEISYYPEAYSWDYRWSLPASYYVQKVEMCIELGVIFVSCALYFAVLINLCVWRRKWATDTSKTASKHERTILYQAMTITVYCTVLNFSWHNVALLGINTVPEFMALNYMWILNSGVYPILYLSLNSTIRKRFLSHAKLPLKPTTTAVRPLVSNAARPQAAAAATTALALTSKAVAGFRRTQHI